MINKKYDVIIVGAGPSGATSALCLANSGFKIAIIDKANFPREKTCGDGLTMDVTNQLPIVSKQLSDEFLNFKHKVASWSVNVINSKGLFVNFEQLRKGKKIPIYICKRKDFDNLLLNQLKQYDNIDIFENCIAKKINNSDDNIIIETNIGSFESNIIIGADGFNSFVARQMGIKRISKDFQVVTLRTYYKNVKPLSADNPIEFYIFKETLPNYLWIFNMENNTANIGFGISASEIIKKKINLNNYFESLLEKEPLKSRLKNSERIEPIKGSIINIGGERRIISGNRFLLTGDAAALADPISGEGVGNAIRSGRIAAEHIINCYKDNNFSAKYNNAYDKEVYRRLLSEFKFHLFLKKIFSVTWIVNYIINSAVDYKIIRDSLRKVSTNLFFENSFQKIIFFFKLLYIFTLQRIYASAIMPKEKNRI